MGKVGSSMRRKIVFVAVGAGLALATPVASAHSIHLVNKTGHAQGAGWFMPAVVRDANYYVGSWWGTGQVYQSRRGWPVRLVNRWLGRGVLGYHSVSYGEPYAVISVPATAWAGLPLSLVVSHEVNEMTVDPYLTRSKGGYHVEVCDPVVWWYGTIWGTEVADFVTPAWYVWGSYGPWDSGSYLSGDHEFSSQGYEPTSYFKVDPKKLRPLHEVTLRANRDGR
jgi:hypothetical protein